MGEGKLLSKLSAITNLQQETGKMSVKDTSEGQLMSKAKVMEMLSKRFEKLPDFDRKLFAYGPFYLGANAGLAGLIANSLYRRALNVVQGRFTSGLPMSVLPFLTTVALYNGVVSNPLLVGDLNCPTCALLRGALVGVIGGGIYPIFLALPINAGLAARYNSAPLPEKGNIFRFWTTLSKPIVRKMYAVLLLQTLFGTYLGSKHFEIYLKMLKFSESHSDDLHD